MYNIDKFNHGEDYATKRESLAKDFLEIEKSNIDFFKNRPHKLNKTDHDRLNMHYQFTFLPNQGHTFGFNQDSDLPENIKKLCFVSLHKHFPE
jgi:hypothetical protein